MPHVVDGSETHIGCGVPSCRTTRWMPPLAALCSALDASLSGMTPGIVRARRPCNGRRGGRGLPFSVYGGREGSGPGSSEYGSPGKRAYLYL